jgi:hypothetical protein
VVFARLRLIVNEEVAEGGPVPPTHNETNEDYVYALTMNNHGKVAKIQKVWNTGSALKELGWT